MGLERQRATAKKRRVSVGGLDLIWLHSPHARSATLHKLFNFSVSLFPYCKLKTIMEAMSFITGCWQD